MEAKMARKPEIPKQWIMTSDVARFFDVSERKVFDWINTGVLPTAGRIGKQFYFRVEDIREACEANKLR